MKKTLVSFLAGAALATIVFATYSHFNMINMSNVAEIHDDGKDVEITLENGSCLHDMRPRKN